MADVTRRVPPATTPPGRRYRIGSGTVRYRIIATGLAWTVTGCAVGPDFHAPKAPELARYTAQPLPASVDANGAGDRGAQVFVTGRDVAGAWWGLFRSPRLTALVATALARNPSLAAARETLRQAQETTLAAEGGFFPQIGGTVSRERQKVSLGQVGYSSPIPGAAAGELFSVYTAQLSVSYTFDVWGQTRRMVESGAAQAEMQRFQLEAAANMLAANTVTASINAAALEAEIEAEQKLVGAEQSLLDTVKRQFQLGGATGTDVATQETQLANTEALVVPLQTQLVQARDQLAAYLGQAPSEADIPPMTLDELTLPGEVPVSLPSALVAQRPDIRAAQAQLHALTAQVGIAVSNRLPQFTLTGAIGTAPSQAGQLFTPGNGFWALTNQLAGPLFEGGTLLHQQRAAQAAMRAQAATYRSVVVGAFQNVADVLTALSQDARALAANDHAARAAARSLSLSQLQYGAGGVAYPIVLQAQTQYQQAVIGLIRARAARYTDTVALFAALGGGWWNRADVGAAPDGVFGSLLQ
jgi:NodT family efflux transporter outer membrane factor (OMF) lipoprotein